MYTQYIYIYMYMYIHSYLYIDTGTGCQVRLGISMARGAPLLSKVHVSVPFLARGLSCIYDDVWMFMHTHACAHLDMHARMYSCMHVIL